METAEVVGTASEAAAVVVAVTGVAAMVAATVAGAGGAEGRLRWVPSSLFPTP